MGLIEKISAAGVVGAGGAGFPTHIKYSAEIEYLILNAAECEPLIHSDKYLIRTRAKDIVDTMLIIGKHMKASKLIIAMKKTYTKEIEILKQVIGSHNIEILQMNSFYPAGDEQVMILEATGRRVPIGKLPKDIGVAVSNVGTVCDTADALNDIPKTTKTLSVIGDVKIPSIVEASIGMKVSECLEKVGLLNAEFSVIMGGPMMGKIYNCEDIGDLTITKTSNSLIVLAKDHYLLKRQNTPIQHLINQANSACIQCRMCTELCPRFLLGHPLQPHKVMRNIAFGNIEENPVFEESLLCCECGVCDIVCPMHLSPRRINQLVKRTLAGKKFPKGELREPELYRGERLLPSYRLVYMIDVNRYKEQIPQQTVTFTPNTVWIPLKQHIGKESEPVVKVGDAVKQGDLIAQIATNALGANIHASISGKVTEITNQYICIKK